MSFDTKYTNLTSEGDVRCLTPEGPKFGCLLFGL